MDILPMLILGGAGLIAAVILYIVAKRFHVDEDERIGAIESILPGANCGACGRKGCHDFAVACCGASSLDGLLCPGAGSAGMKKIAEVLGLADKGSAPKKAFIRCNGSTCNRLVKRNIDAIASCRLASTLAMPSGYCSWGCLGCGDCVDACKFGAIAIDPKTGIPTVDIRACTGCGACAKACPQKIISIIEIKQTDNMVVPTVWVSCNNQAKGGVARKMCTAACIGCGKCVRTCPYQAITLDNNRAVIDPALCKGCGDCVSACPTKAIHIMTCDI